MKVWVDRFSEYPYISLGNIGYFPESVNPCFQWDHGGLLYSLKCLIVKKEIQ